MHIRVDNVTKTFGSVRANDAVSIEFAPGQIHGLLGENGAGKSTLMKLLSGFLRPDSGRILLDAQSVCLRNPAMALRAGVGMIHQDPLDIPLFSVLENFYCASPRSIIPNLSTAHQKLMELSERFGFSIPLTSPVGSLTVGQRQQLEIMRLLAYGVQVLILDEPTTGITATQKLALFAALRQLAQEGKTILFVSHKLGEVAELCHTVSVLRAGRLMGEGQMMLPQPQTHLLTLMFNHNIEPESAQILGGPALHKPQPENDQADAPSLPPTWHLRSVTVPARNLDLRTLTLTIPSGIVLGLSGLEGSGQQSVLRLLAGELRPNTGRVWVSGRDMTGMAAPAYRAAGVHYLPADRLVEGLVGALSLTDHFVLRDATSRPHINRQSAQALAQMAITDYAIKARPATPIASLSGGNQQRAMLALLPPHCTGLLLDQPTRGLDMVSARSVWQRLLSRRDVGTALVFASADFDELLLYSDYVLVFYAGGVSHPLPRASLTGARLAELIGGVGFDEVRMKDEA